MAACIRDETGLPTDGQPTTFLWPPFDAYDPAQLLAHFRARTGVAYFPILDEDETERAKIDAILDNRFTFNHECHELAWPGAWLANPSADIEWHILLHKFYYAGGLGERFQQTGDARYVHKWVELTETWMAVTPPGFIAADVTGRRIQNWIYAHYYFVTDGRAASLPPDFYVRFLASLSEQVEWLCASLAPARNHRTLELYAIFLAAVVFPEMCGAARWLEFSLAEIAQNVVTDLLPDGVQVELSTDYHHIVLRNFLCVRRLAKLNNIAVPPAMDRALVKALEFALHAHRPDGIVPAFSDGDARDYRTLLDWGDELYGRGDFAYVATSGAHGRPPTERCARFDDSGYYTLRSGWGEREPFRDERFLLFDCGPLGAGNHGHFDLLSFEAYAYGRPLIVDPGRYTYDEAGAFNWRAKFRGTESHNTVLVDGRNQTRYTMAPGKRKLKVSGPAPRHALQAAIQSTSFDLLHGVATSQEYDAVHERLIAFVAGEYWIVSDLLHSETSHRYDLQFHLAQCASDQVRQRVERRTCLIEAPHLILAQAASDATISTTIETGFVSQRYGEKQPAPVVRATRQAANAAFHTIVFPYRDKAPVLLVRELSVTTGDGSQLDHRTQALAITIGGDSGAITDIWYFSTAAIPQRCTFAGYSFTGPYAWVRENAAGDVIDCHKGPHPLCDRSGRAIAESKEVGS